MGIIPKKIHRRVYDQTNQKEKAAFSGDDFGLTAMEGIENNIEAEKNNVPLLYEIWQEIKEPIA